MMTEWHVKPTAGHDRHGQSVVYDDDGRSIAIVYDGRTHGNLIAAAPALLAALDEITDLPADDEGNRIIPAGFLDAARAAIAQATA